MYKIPVFIFLSVLDLLTTEVALKLGASELNPLALWLIEKNLHWEFKTILVGIVSYIMYLAIQKGKNIHVNIVIFIMLFVVLNNSIIVLYLTDFSISGIISTLKGMI